MDAWVKKEVSGLDLKRCQGWPASYGRPSGVLAGGQLLVLMSFGQSSSEYASFVYSPSTSVYVPKFDQGPEQETGGAR
ncbi:hypothetical protein N7532_004473 [Penicillium argentinense]|uniref:Uncharacterized protein n=1 Tax=Penicillium argentinense TaxID=1131581 RepID=A0A9W9FPF0_9EURO|nr:uncharacterized protein N7532_004473 [Penicillium argentinense]KAJ5103944.1 hypothetical protein N7532_004473 [Penicillium argentinense]